MSLLEVPPFDALRGGGRPCEAFGAILRESALACLLESVAGTARRRVQDVFQRDVALDRRGVGTLDGLVREMWSAGWSPERGDVNLFANDFGSILMLAIHRELGGECLFRSPTDLSHASVWWPASDVEAFPFHKAYKALLRQEAEGFGPFFDGLLKFVSHEQQR